MRRLDEHIRKMTDAPYTLAALEVQDWNRDYSPWPAPAAFGKAEFSGGGEETFCALRELAKLTDYGQKQYVGGYSLAGLFALWTFYHGEGFDGAASCSGSLWYPDCHRWREFASLPAGCRIYLSLGKKEEKTRNRLLSQVGEATRAQYEALCRDGNVQDAVLVWNEGGHFNDPTLRMAKGFAWLLDE